MKLPIFYILGFWLTVQPRLSVPPLSYNPDIAVICTQSQIPKLLISTVDSSLLSQTPSYLDICVLSLDN